MKRGRALRLGHFDDAAECAVQHAVLQKRVCLPQHCLRSQGPSAALSKPIQETRKTCTGWKEYMVQLCRTGVGKGGNLGRPRGDAGPWACSNPKCTEGTDGSAQEGDCGLTQTKKKKKNLAGLAGKGERGACMRRGAPAVGRAHGQGRGRCVVVSTARRKVQERTVGERPGGPDESSVEARKIEGPGCSTK